MRVSWLPPLVPLALSAFWGCSNSDSRTAEALPGRDGAALDDANALDAGALDPEDSAGDSGSVDAPAPEPAFDAPVEATPSAMVWSTSIGSWCGPADDRTWWLVAAPDAACQTRAEYIQGSASDGLIVELSSAALQSSPSETVARARWCSGGTCQWVDASLSVDEYQPEIGARGSWRAALADGTTLSRDFDATWCRWDDHLAAHPEGTGRVRGLRLYEIAVFQAVKVPIMQRLLEVTERNAEVVTGRSALLRAYVVPTNLDFQARGVRARLTLVRQDEMGQDEAPEVFEQTQTISGESSDGSLESSFNFEIPAELIQESTRYSLELFEAEPCAVAEGEAVGARFPQTGLVALGAQAVGEIRVQLVPVHNATSQGILVPETSPEQVESYRQTITRLFPITGAEITLRAQPLEMTASTMTEVLDQITALRDAENPERDVSYYGMVRFTADLDEYCAESCVLGGAVVGEPSIDGTVSGGTAVGVGYADERAWYTFAHEMGHVYGRPHSPCMIEGDPEYPYRAGGIGTWGYDIVERQMIDPALYSDLMGYCRPIWISDYVYHHLQTFVGDVNIAAAQVAPSTSMVAPSTSMAWSTLLLEARAAPRWGVTRPVWGEPRGVPEQAEVLDRLGNVLSSVTVYRSKLADLDGDLVYVPARRDASWWSVRVRGRPPHAFSAGGRP